MRTYRPAARRNTASISPSAGHRNSAAASRGRTRNMSSTNRAKRGFTLVEVMVSSVVAAMFLPVLSVSSASTSKVDTLGAATTALYQMEADIRVATTGGITVGSAAATPNPTLGSSAEVTELAVEVPEKMANVNDNYGQPLYDSGTGLSDFETYVVYALVSETNGG